MAPAQLHMKAILLILVSLCFNAHSFLRNFRRLPSSIHGQSTILYQNKQAGSSSSISKPRPSPQMIPVPFDFFEEEEESNSFDEYDGLFDGSSQQTYGITEKTIATTVPVMSFERDFDAGSSTMLELIFESPYDSPAAVRAKNVLRSIILLVMLLGTTFTASYYVFPGSFQPYTVIGQFHPRYTTSLPSLVSFEQAEYSESGGVVWGETDDFSPKTTVTIQDGLVISTQEPYEIRLLPLEDL